jgi:hypothetical protein
MFAVFCDYIKQKEPLENAMESKRGVYFNEQTD